MSEIQTEVNRVRPDLYNIDSMRARLPRALGHKVPQPDFWRWYAVSFSIFAILFIGVGLIN